MYENIYMGTSFVQVYKYTNSNIFLSESQGIFKCNRFLQLLAKEYIFCP